MNTEATFCLLCCMLSLNCIRHEIHSYKKSSLRLEQARFAVALHHGNKHAC